MIKKFIIVLSIFAAISSSNAGTFIGNSACVVWNPDRPWLQDLFERDNLVSTFTPKSERFTFFKNQLSNRGLDEGYSLDLIAQKLDELASLDSVFALSILKSIQFYSWSFVDAAITNSLDCQESPIDLSKYKVTPVAFRKERVIFINFPIWVAMTSEHRAALIFHEALYALLRPDAILDDWSNKPWFQQSSLKVREVVGYIFSNDLQSKKRTGLLNIVRSNFPYSKDQSSLLLNDENSISFNFSTFFKFKNSSGFEVEFTSMLPALQSDLEMANLLCQDFELVESYSSFDRFDFLFSKLLNSKGFPFTYLAFEQSTHVTPNILNPTPPKDCAETMMRILKTQQNPRMIHWPN